MSARRCTALRCLTEVLVVGIAVFAALPVAGAHASATPDQPSDVATSPEDELLATYAPVIAVREQPTDCESGEPYLPMSVEDLFAVPGLLLRGPDGDTVAEPTLDDLADITPGDDWHIDVPGNALRPECSYERLYDDLAATPVTYGRVATDPDHPGTLVVQYWFLYIYNDWNDRHEGDWEMIQLVFDAEDAATALETEPVRVMYAQHEGGELSDWNGGPLQRRAGTHPMVFVGEGSHASYFSSERWFGKSAQSGFGCDDTRPVVDEVSPRVVRLRGDEPWVAFTGRWGEQQPSFNNGPTGPATKMQWASPVTWVNAEGRVGAVELPNEGSFATSAFCATVRVGSLAFLRFLDSPVRAALAVAAVVLAATMLVRRTRWRDATLEPLLQRRRAGQHLGAAILLMRAHPALFAPLGALLPIAGLLAAGLQWLLTEHTELGDGLALVGSGSPWGSVVVALLGLLIVVPFTSVVYVAVAAAVRDLAADTSTASWTRALASVRRHPRGVAAELLTRAFTNALLFTAILAPLAVWLLARWCVVASSSLESPHPIRRSALLTRGHRIRTGALAGLVAALAVAIPALSATLLLLLTGWSFLLVNVAASLVAAVVIPVTAATMALLHGDPWRRAPPSPLPRRERLVGTRDQRRQSDRRRAVSASHV